MYHNVCKFDYQVDKMINSIYEVEETLSLYFKIKHNFECKKNIQSMFDYG